MASKALESGEELLAALLDVSTLEAGVTPVHRRAFPLQCVLAGLANEAAPVAAAKNLSLRVVPSGAIVDSDPVLLARMLRNLVVNAIRYTQTGGVLIGCRGRGDRLRIEVRDSGVGIPAAEHGLIFEDFYQIGNEARDRSIGLGLGLSVVSRCARLLDHPLSLRST
ncbi:MAG: HAMP domain-containing histidine kinase, partial [Alphaproteobacteria bacterium]|nr:HAMP domain-containing histidine kinase [Alphaproteobacteria bacterium]